MKVIAIIGSMRSGNSYSMVRSVEDTIVNKGVELETFHLRDISMSFCDGCLTCDETGECHLNDDMSIIVKKIKESDGLIFASPTRWSLLSGELKVFMDRLNPLAASDALSGKKAIIFTVGQTKKEEDNSISIATESIVSFCENSGIEVVDKVSAFECLMENEVNLEISKKCIEATDRLLDAIN